MIYFNRRIPIAKAENAKQIASRLLAEGKPVAYLTNQQASNGIHNPIANEMKLNCMIDLCGWPNGYVFFEIRAQNLRPKAPSRLIEVHA